MDWAPWASKHLAVPDNTPNDRVLKIENGRQKRRDASITDQKILYFSNLMKVLLPHPYVHRRKLLIYKPGKSYIFSLTWTIQCNSVVAWAHSTVRPRPCCTIFDGLLVTLTTDIIQTSKLTAHGQAYGNQQTMSVRRLTDRSVPHCPWHAVLTLCYDRHRLSICKSGWVVRKAINANPGLKVQGNIILLERKKNSQLLFSVDEIIHIQNRKTNNFT